MQFQFQTLHQENIKFTPTKLTKFTLAFGKKSCEVLYNSNMLRGVQLRTCYLSFKKSQGQVVLLLDLKTEKEALFRNLTGSWWYVLQLESL